MDALRINKIREGIKQIMGLVVFPQREMCESIEWKIPSIHVYVL